MAAPALHQIKTQLYKVLQERIRTSASWKTKYNLLTTNMFFTCFNIKIVTGAVGVAACTLNPFAMKNSQWFNEIIPCI
jgi:hypothetical protein